ncbi:molybdopterin-dependent oxidoreductase [Adlercreutzia sp. ZJ473]|uniref:molybdopterin-containing oxidoreductase family protein n=1 Tax=Adlercreutzia sp. ZJ473 TaxID=2722822 RepID=UPI00155314B3|nr:molybdopterin-dependent oxidoreductase [Adlercreutzia sp. ZJ473]
MDERQDRAQLEAQGAEGAGAPYPKTQDDPAGRKWTWEEDGCTVIRSNARSGPGCHDNCGILMYVRDGVLEKIEGDPENPYNQGRLCPRCLAFKEMLYHEDRLRHPLKRAREDRGKNAFERISWEEAYDIIEREMKKVAEAYGPESIWVTQGTGRDINGYGPLMAQYLGTPNYGTGFLSGQACYAPRIFSTALKAGGLFVCDYSQFFPDRYDDPRWEAPEYILIWGNNPVVANSDGTLGHWVVESMKRGSKLIVMDPVLTWVAGKAEVFLQLRPGTDAALALALCNVIIEEGLEDKEFVDLWCYGFNEFKEHVRPCTAAFAAETCGVPEELVVKAARCIGSAKSACLQWGVAMDHTSEGFITGMACFDLMALTGNFEKPGTMVAARPTFDMSVTWMPSEKVWRACSAPVAAADKTMNGKYPALKAMDAISPDMLLEALETGEPYPIKAMFMMQNNAIACMGAQPQRILPALQGTDFNVVVDLFLTPTALACADVLLPAACFAERLGITGHQPYALGAIAQAVEPLGECRSDQRIIYEVGSRFTSDEYKQWDDEQGFYDYLLRNTGFTYESLRERTWAYPEFEYRKYEKGLLRRKGEVGFATSTGRYNFYCPEMLHFGLSPLATYEEPPESPVSRPDLAEKYPLVLTTGARIWGFFHSEHRQSASMRSIHPDPTILIHPETAARHGIAEGDWVKVENNFGSCRQKAKLTVRIRKDTVSADHAWWFPERDPEDGTLFGVMECNINKLVPMRPGKVGLGASYKSQLCAISKVEE